MPKKKTNRAEDLNAADVLAEFANLSAKEMPAFRKRHPNFAPDKWWDYQPNVTDTIPRKEVAQAVARVPPHMAGDIATLVTGVQQATEGYALPKQWVLTQQRLSKAWGDWNSEQDVPLSQAVQLLASVFDPDALLEKQYDSQRRPTYADVTELNKKYGFHKAVEFLAGSPWRAGICENPRKSCLRKFIRSIGEAKYCSPDCTNDGRRQTVLAGYHRTKKRTAI